MKTSHRHSNRTCRYHRRFRFYRVRRVASSDAAVAGIKPKLIINCSDLKTTKTVPGLNLASGKLIKR